MVIRQKKDLTQIAVLEDKVLVEHYVARESQTSLIGNVYLGRVQNVLPSMEAAFIDIGKGRNAVLYAGEVNWDALGAGNGPRKIEQVLKSGQAVLVQVTKDPIGHKGARLTSQVSLPGRFLVYVPDGNTSGISRTLPDTERTRLKNLLKEIVPDTAGVIVRTAAEGASEDELTRDVERLTARWADIESKVEKGNAPQLLYGEPDLTLKVVRDLFTEDFGRLVVSGDDAWDMVENYVGHVAPDLAERLERYDGNEDVFAAYRIDEQIAKALDRKVWLPSGGSLIIDRTEAMTVVDVNTGKFTGSGGNLEETVTKNNLEAAEEIVRQLRLRDIGGIIVVDFIDMVLESNRDLVLRRMVECLGRDRTRHQVAEVTSLGLVQMTRKRIGTGLLEAFSENCEHCQGRGLVVHHEPVENRRKPDEEPRRGRRGRGRGDDDNAGNGNGNGSGAPTPKDVAAMARSGQSETAVETPGVETPAVETPAVETAAVETAAEEPAEGSRRRSRGRGGRSGGGSEKPASEEPQASAQPEPVAQTAAEVPAEPAQEPEEKPATRARTRTGRGSSRREAGPPAASAEAAVVVVPANDTAATDASAEAGAVPETTPEAPPAPRIVTSTRRKVARRPAGPPVGGLADTGPVDAGSVSPNGSAGGSSDGSGTPDEATNAPAHVPVKKKGTRKR
jgi:ribonuclease E